LDHSSGAAHYGAKTKEGKWAYEICQDDTCSLLNLECPEQTSNGDLSCSEEDRNNASLLIDYFHRSSLGDGLSQLSSRQRHLFVRLAFTASEYKLELPAWVGTANTPPGYCGQLDFHSPSNATALQNLLNNRGFDVGIVDGVLGKLSFDAIQKANRSLLGVDFREPSEKLFVALGKSKPEAQKMLLCQ